MTEPERPGSDEGTDASRGVDVAFADADEHCMLLRDTDESAMLVNTCDDVEGFLDRQDVSPDDLDAVMVTDYDVDQSDRLERLADAADDLLVFVPDVSARELRQEQSRLEAEREELGADPGYGPGRGHGTGSSRGPAREPADTPDDGVPVPDEEEAAERERITEELERLQQTADNKEALNETLARRDVDVAPVHEDQPPEIEAPLAGYSLGVVAPPSHAVRNVVEPRVNRLVTYMSDAPAGGRGGFDVLVTGRLDAEAVPFVLDSFDHHYDDEGMADAARRSFDPDVVDAVPAGPSEDVSPLVSEGEPAAVVYTGGDEPDEAAVEAAREAGVERIYVQGEGGDVVESHRVREWTESRGQTVDERSAGEAAEDRGVVDGLDPDEPASADGVEEDDGHGGAER